jgi:hypothetical protein
MVGNAAFALDLSGATPGAAAFVFVGSGLAPSSYDLGGGCFFDLELSSVGANFDNGIYLGPVIVDNTGHAVLPAPIPPIGALHGLAAAVQCVTIYGVFESSSVLGLVVGS